MISAFVEPDTDKTANQKPCPHALNTKGRRQECLKRVSEAAEEVEAKMVRKEFVNA